MESGWVILFGIYKAIRVAVMHAHYDGQAETMSLLLKQHCHESSSISPCLVALYDWSQKCLQRNSSMINMDFIWSGGWQWWFRTCSGYIKGAYLLWSCLSCSVISLWSYCLSNGSKLSNSYLSLYLASVTYLFISVLFSSNNSEATYHHCKDGVVKLFWSVSPAPLH